MNTILINQEKIKKWISTVKTEVKCAIVQDSMFIEFLHYDNIDLFEIKERKIILQVLNKLQKFIIKWYDLEGFVEISLFESLQNAAQNLKQKLECTPILVLLLDAFLIPLHTDEKLLDHQLKDIWIKRLKNYIADVDVEISIQDYIALGKLYNNADSQKEYNDFMYKIAIKFEDKYPAVVNLVEFLPSKIFKENI